MRLDRVFAVAMALVAAGVSPAWAVRPAESLLSNSTEGFLATPHIEELIDNWDQTQLGQLMNDPSMKLFRDDLQRQLEAKLSVDDTLGLTWKDVRGLSRGEVSLAYINLNDKPAQALLVDVTDNLDQAQKVLDKVSANLTKLGGVRKPLKVGDTDVMVFDVPADEKKKRPAQRRAYFIKDNLLCASQSLAVAQDILSRFSGDHDDSLEDLEAFQSTVGRCRQKAGDVTPDVRWFLDPFGFMRAHRLQHPDHIKPNEIDYYEVLTSVGFDAVKGAGGYVNFGRGVDDILHRTMVYAPGEYTKSMKMASLINEGDQTPPQWVPAEIATYTSANLKMLAAFDNFDPLFDALFGEGEQGVWAEVVESLHKDKHGPKVHLRNDLFAHLRDRVTLITDYKMPITPKSERRVVGIETKDEKKVAERQTADGKRQERALGHRR